VALYGHWGTERTSAEVSMSRTKNNGKAAREAASRGMRKARAWAAPQVERTGQVIQDTVAPAASRGVRRVRAWAAPQVERTGHVIQDTVAPKVAATLQSSARRLDPGKPKRGGWRKPAAAISVLLAAAASAAAAALRKRSGSSTPADEDAEPATDEAKASGNAKAKKPASTSCGSPRRPALDGA
jgi:hypothetical protein